MISGVGCGEILYGGRGKKAGRHSNQVLIYIFVGFCRGMIMQISAVISEETQRLLEATVQKRGLKKGFVIEAALRHHLLALNSLPGEFITPPVINVTPESWDNVTQALTQNDGPTPAMQALMADD